VTRLKRTGFVGAAVTLLATLAAGCGSGGGSSTSVSSVPTSSAASSTGAAASLAPTTGTYSPKINPADFVATIDNRYFPLKPGTAWRYQGVQEDGKTPQTDDVVVTSQTKDILGVKSTVVRDTVSSRGKPVERTFDWYAQDRAGNVWYMGEDASEVKNGRFVRAADSWEAGVNGAQPGIIMPGDPQPDGSYRQEYYPGHAEDQATILGSGGPLTVPDRSFQQTLLTEEKAPRVDPGVVERKYYVAGVGEVKEQVVSGNHEQIQLVSVTR
jgi:hypothetical protein